MFLGLGGACAGDAPTDCMGPNGPCIVVTPGADAHSRLQSAMITAATGDVILIKAGSYDLAQGLSLDVDGVTLRGEGMARTILSFANQVDGAEGVLVTADDVTVEDLAIEDAAGDGLKFSGASGVTVRRVRAEWTDGPSAKNGGYGIYPVGSTNVLIEECQARGASDTGIYVGQSNHIVVRNNVAWENVAGIEIENSQDADVYGNETTGNTGGILVFNLPGLAVKDGRRIRVFDNDIHDNNEANFAAPGNIVGKVPQGTGFAVISAREVEFFGNRVADNQTANFAVVSYLLLDLEWDDPEFDPYPETIWVHDNTFSGGGTMASGELGFVLISALSTIMEAPIVVPDLVIDGYFNPEHAVEGVIEEQYRFCARDNGDADFVNLDAPSSFAAVSTDATPHDCEHPALPAVEIPGVE